VPIVPGGFVGAMALDAIGLHGWGALLVGMGIGGWALLEVRILHRLFAGALPPALTSTIGIEMAPGAVGVLSAATLWPQLPAEALMVGLGVASGPILAVLTRWRWWSAAPFSFGFWAFAFPIAALAGASIEAVRRGGWPSYMALGAALLASAVAAYLAVRTLWLLVRGRLLPPQ
jgi:tellurite resistance protein